jgi:hypothetical protein
MSCVKFEFAKSHEVKISFQFIFLNACNYFRLKILQTRLPRLHELLTAWQTLVFFITRNYSLSICFKNTYIIIYIPLMVCPRRGSRDIETSTLYQK